MAQSSDRTSSFTPFTHVSRMMISSSVACVTAQTLLSPLDTIRHALLSYGPRMHRAMQHRWRTHGGLISLWRHGSRWTGWFTLLRMDTMCFFDELQRRRGVYTGNEGVDRLLAASVGGAVAGGVTAWIMYPFCYAHALCMQDRLRAVAEYKKGERHLNIRLTSNSAALRQIWETEGGLKGLWKHFGSVSTPYIAHSAVYLGGFYSIQRSLPWQPNFASDLALAISVSFVASWVVSPIERRVVLAGMPPVALVEHVVWGVHNQGSRIGAVSGGALPRRATDEMGKKFLRYFFAGQVLRSGLVLALTELVMRWEGWHERYPPW